jgi:hypothetical protein
MPARLARIASTNAKYGGADRTAKRVMSALYTYSVVLPLLMGIAMKIMKLFWQQRQDGAYAIVDMKGLDLLGLERSGQDFFAVRDDIVVTQRHL